MKRGNFLKKVLALICAFTFVMPMISVTGTVIAEEAEKAQQTDGQLSGVSIDESLKFSITESFGINFSSQVVTFPLEDSVQRLKISPEKYRLLDYKGHEIPYQIIEDGAKLAILTDLPANETRSFEFEKRPAKNFNNVVQVDDSHKDYIEITNGLTGVRILKEYEHDGDISPKAPIQGIRYADGTWSEPATDLYVGDKKAPEPNNGEANKLLELTVTEIESGPIRAVYAVEYKFDVKELFDYDRRWYLPNGVYGGLYDFDVIYEAGEGYHKDIIQLDAGQTSIQIETASNINVEWSLSMYDAVEPNQMRYIGHSAQNFSLSDQDTERWDIWGHRPYKGEEGEKYQQYFNSDWGHEALVNIDYDLTLDVGQFPSVDLHTRPRMTTWNPWAYNTGWYYSLYNQGGESSSNAVGIYAGAPSRLVNVGSVKYGVGLRYPNDEWGLLGFNYVNSGVGIYTGTYDANGVANYKPEYDASTASRDAGITVNTEMSLFWAGSARKSNFGGVRYDWGIYVGTNDDIPGSTKPAKEVVEEDLSARATDEYPSNKINQQMIRYGNGVSLDQYVSWMPFGFEDDPNRTYGAMYLDPAVIEEYKQLDNKQLTEYGFPEEIRKLWTGEVSPEEQAAASHEEFLVHLEEWVNGGGFRHGDQPWLWPGRELIMWDQILGMDVTDETKDSIKEDISLWGNVLHTLDFYPIMWEESYGDERTVAGIGLGTANMPEQWDGAKEEYTLYLSTHPVIGKLAEKESDFYDINEEGASMHSGHYVRTGTPGWKASYARTISNKANIDWENNPKLSRFAEWCLDMSVPADPRFTLPYRSWAVDGNGPAQWRPSLPGELAAASSAYTSDPQLLDASARLMWLWDSMGRPVDDFYGPSMLRTNPNLPMSKPELGNATYPSYFSVLRNSFDTPIETSVHLFNGNFYKDHRHVSNQVDIYALGVPLSLNWEYYFEVPYSTNYIRSGLLPADSLKGVENYNDDMAPANNAVMTIMEHSVWNVDKEYQNFFNDFSNSGATSVHTEHVHKDLTWDRSAKSIHPNEEYPVIILEDEAKGEIPNQGMVMTLPMMAIGDVTVTLADGQLFDISPKEKFFNSTGDPNANGTPSGGTSYQLKPGLNRFQFTGQQFGTENNKKPAIDWDLYIVSDGNQEFCIGNWGSNKSGMAVDFAGMQLSDGSWVDSYQQRQHLLRVKGTNNFYTVIVPRQRGAETSEVTLNGNHLTVSVNGETTVIDLAGQHTNSYIYDDANGKVVLTNYSGRDGNLEYQGYQLTGGAAEAVIKGHTATITLSGEAGQRTFRVPEGYQLNVSDISGEAEVTTEGTTCSIMYQGDQPYNAPQTVLTLQIDSVN